MSMNTSCQDIMNPTIEEDKIEPLLQILDPSINPRIVQTLIFQYLGIPRGNIAIGSLRIPPVIFW